MARGKTLNFISNGEIIGEINDRGSIIRNAREAVEILKRQGRYKEQSQAMLMFHQARSFAKISRNIHQQSLIVPPYDPSTCAPFVVNAAFACEMYLKMMLRLHDKQKNTHNLIALFKLLPNKLKDQINKITKQKEGDFRLESHLFKDQLKTISNAFVDWRYIYEQEEASININRILLILAVLDTLACSEIKNESKAH